MFAHAVSFRADIAPLLQRRCLTCHGEDNSKGGYRLDSYARLMKAGDTELSPVTPGRPEQSELYRLLLESDPHDRMPQKADALPPEQIGLVGRWIEEGAQYDGGSADRPLVELARQSLLRPAPETYRRPAPVATLAWSPDGRQIAVNGYFEVTIWNASDGSLMRRIRGLPERITSIAWSRSGDFLGIAGGSPGQWGTVALVQLKGTGVPQILCDLSETALCVAFTPDGSQLIAGCGDRTVRLFTTQTGKQTKTLRQHADWVQTIALDAEGKKFVTASRDRTSRVFSASSGELESTYTGHEAPLLGAIFLKSPSQVLSLDRMKNLQAWDVGSQKRLTDFKAADTDARTMLVMDDKLVTAGTSAVIAVDQLSDRQRLFTLRGHHSPIQALAAGPVSQRFASGAADGEVIIWDLACGTWISRFVPSPGW